MDTDLSQGKMQEFVGQRLKRNNISIFKSVLILKVCFKISKECACDAFSNRFFCKRMKGIFLEPSFNNKAT